MLTQIFIVKPCGEVIQKAFYFQTQLRMKGWLPSVTFMTSNPQIMTPRTGATWAIHKNDRSHMGTQERRDRNLLWYHVRSHVSTKKLKLISEGPNRFHMPCPIRYMKPCPNKYMKPCLIYKGFVSKLNHKSLNSPFQILICLLHYFLFPALLGGWQFLMQPAISAR